ncbi:MAG: sulfatase [Wenzhouxiangellaceae bacterium]
MGVLVLLWLAGCSPPAPQPPPNIVLISIDTLRADYLSPWGFDPQATPNIARLAEGGVIYTRAVSPMGITVPVHTTLLTGLMPRTHRVRANVHRLPDEIATITEQLHSAGYQTASILSFGAMNFMSGLDRGFEYASDRDPSDRAFVRPDADTVARVGRWLAGRNDPRALFLFVHLYDVHSPHEVTDWSRVRLAGVEGPLADGVSVEELYHQSGDWVGDERALSALRTLYAGEVVEADRHVGQVLDQLEASGVLDDSVVVLVADHGQGLGENGYFGHGPTLEQTVLHVPLIIRDFRKATPGRQVHQTVGLIDVAPTLLALAGLPHDSLPGSNLLDLAPDGERLEPYLSEVEQRSSQTEFRPAWFDDEALAVYFGDYKLVDQEGQQRLYRIDPVWGQKIAPADPGELNETVRLWLLDLMDDYRNGRLQSERAPLDDEALESLRSLGYIQ